MAPRTYQQLQPEQQHALDLILSGRNVFLTGRAGTGKSAVVHQLRRHNPPNSVFLAPTDMGALGIGGQSVHRFLGLPARASAPGYVHPLTPAGRAVVAATQTVVVDEINLVRSDLFATLEATLRSVPLPGGSHLAFGGRQVVVVGDFLQLVPDVGQGEERARLVNGFGGVFPFQTEAWARAGFVHVCLSEPHRQGQDPRFVEALDAIRLGTCDRAATEEAVRWLNANTMIGGPPDKSIVLCSDNRAEARTTRMRAPEEDDEFRFLRSCAKGRLRKSSYPTERLLELRPNHRVMLLCDVWNEGRRPYANGDVGTVLGIESVQVRVRVMLDNGDRVDVFLNTWTMLGYTVEEDESTGLPRTVPEGIGWFTQYPLVLAYAVAVRKTRGMSLDRIHLDFGQNALGCGELYTALSRCRSVGGLSLAQPLRAEDVQADPAVVEFYQRLAGTHTAPPPGGTASRTTPNG